jgi:glycerophosphoryl diester phosphodiesterase
MDYIEIDIRTAQDGSLFLLHDGNLRRTTTGQGPIKAQTAAQLSSLDAGSWFSNHYQQTPLPRLEEGLVAMGKQAAVYLDAKDIAPQALIDAINKHQLWERHVVYQSPEYLQKLKQLDSRARLLPALRSHADLPQIAKLQPYAVDVTWKSLSRELIEDCHQQGIQVFSDALGLNESVPEYQQAIRWGIDVIQTDHPLRVIRAIEGLQQGK